MENFENSAIPLDDDDLDAAAGGTGVQESTETKCSACGSTDLQLQGTAKRCNVCRNIMIEANH